LRRGTAAGLIVDLDDTLYPREQFVTSGFAAVALYVSRTYGVPRDRAFATMARVYAGGRRGQEFQALCRAHRLSLSHVPELVNVFREHRPALWLAPGVVATLRSLRQDGWRIAILTNGLPSVQASKVKALELAPYVDHILYAETYHRGGKPARQAFDAALTALGVAADHCLCVGDDPECDINGAQRIGIRAVHIVPPGTAAHPPADAVIHAFEELPAAAAALIHLVAIDVA
jgi:putative hydrolase of the HAD superfamily